MAISTTLLVMPRALIHSGAYSTECGMSGVMSAKPAVLQVEISKTYGLQEWRDDLRKVLRMAGEANKKVGGVVLCDLDQHAQPACPEQAAIHTCWTHRTSHRANHAMLQSVGSLLAQLITQHGATCAPAGCVPVQ